LSGGDSSNGADEYGKEGSMDKPVSIAVDAESQTVYVVTEGGHVYVSKPEIGAWRDLGPVPGTAAAKKRKKGLK